MRVLLIADEESLYLWDHYKPEKLQGIDLILSAGDLKHTYLEFLVTMASVPVGYIHGNHDACYEQTPPEACICLEDRVVNFGGLRVLGLGGSVRYRPGLHQYTQREMSRRIRRLRAALWRSGGVDLVLTHAPVYGLGDLPGTAHEGFKAFRTLLDNYKPKYLVHGHVHRRYGVDVPRTLEYQETKIINACEKYVLEIPDEILTKKKRFALPRADRKKK